MVCFFFRKQFITNTKNGRRGIILAHIIKYGNTLWVQLGFTKLSQQGKRKTIRTGKLLLLIHSVGHGGFQ